MNAPQVGHDTLDRLVLEVSQATVELVAEETGLRRRRDRLRISGKILEATKGAAQDDPEAPYRILSEAKAFTRGELLEVIRTELDDAVGRFMKEEERRVIEGEPRDTPAPGLLGDSFEPDLDEDLRKFWEPGSVLPLDLPTWALAGPAPRPPSLLERVREWIRRRFGGGS